jgi:RNA polymerase sigma factor (sigma-70 family)
MKNTSVGAGLSKSGLLLEFCEYRPQFLRRIRQWVFSPETAEDIFQEACLKFLVSPAIFRYPEAGTRYFCQILRSLAIDHAKRMARLEYRAVLPEVVCEPQAAWERGMLLDRVAGALRQLRPADRRLLAAYLNPELGRLRDKCIFLHIPSSTLRYRIHGILDRLRAMVG